MTNEKAQQIASKLIALAATPETIKEVINSHFKGFTGYEIHFMTGQANVEFKNGYYFAIVLESDIYQNCVWSNQVIAQASDEKIICNIER